mmetsp:Transcript_70416/g.161449  ORF Transcript_70416/g.161449 Transcript_70416/m.161449 type:complete len:257 (-) Transcript_70416:575-1345(-)
MLSRSMRMGGGGGGLANVMEPVEPSTQSSKSFSESSASGVAVLMRCFSVSRTDVPFTNPSCSQSLASAALAGWRVRRARSSSASAFRSSFRLWRKLARSSTDSSSVKWELTMDCLCRKQHPSSQSVGVPGAPGKKRMRMYAPSLRNFSCLPREYPAGILGSRTSMTSPSGHVSSSYGFPVCSWKIASYFPRLSVPMTSIPTAPACCAYRSFFPKEHVPRCTTQMFPDTCAALWSGSAARMGTAHTSLPSQPYLQCL